MKPVSHQQNSVPERDFMILQSSSSKPPRQGLEESHSFSMTHLDSAHWQTHTNNECLLTLITEVKHILNDRPITAVSSNSRDLKALMPNSLLLGRINSIMPPNIFIKAEGYHNSWKLVHWLAKKFWRRWLKSYFPQLQQHQKWLKPHCNLTPDDLVQVCKKRNSRSQWPKAIVEEVYPGDDKYVYIAKVKTASLTFKCNVCKLCYWKAPNDTRHTFC